MAWVLSSWLPPLVDSGLGTPSVLLYTLRCRPAGTAYPAHVASRPHSGPAEGEALSGVGTGAGWPPRPSARSLSSYTWSSGLDPVEVQGWGEPTTAQIHVESGALEVLAHLPRLAQLSEELRWGLPGLPGSG